MILCYFLTQSQPVNFFFQSVFFLGLLSKSIVFPTSSSLYGLVFFKIARKYLSADLILLVLVFFVEILDFLGFIVGDFHFFSRTCVSQKEYLQFIFK